MQKDLKSVAVGGTFDEFHKGHKILLKKAFEIGEEVLIGLSSDQLAKVLHKPHETAPYEERLKDLEDFLSEHGFLNRAEIVKLDDIYGVTLCEGAVDGLVVSRETEPVADKINSKREEKGLPPLEIVVIDMVPSENHSPISTTRIYRREIDHEGHILKKAKSNSS
ncbi:MAG: phosphopantetheine adenylyltransferase [Thermoproteota archaeon]